jgi:conjugal transfer pilus assembly protein TraW
MQKLLLVAALAASCLGSANAKDLGVQGQIWPITEIDFRQLMLESASKADLNKVQTSVNNFFDTFPRRVLPSPDKTNTRYIDPSITVSNDIKAPVMDAQGNYQWTTLYTKGQRVNPLEKQRPLTAMLYFDGGNEEQVKFVKAAMANNPMRIIPVETAGANVKNLSKAFSRPVFYANEEMMARFRVSELPALLYPGSGDYSLYLGLTAFAAPYKVPELEAVWPVNGTKTAVPLPGASEQDREALRNFMNNASKTADKINENKK